jgi:hypothetical protein
MIATRTVIFILHEEIIIHQYLATAILLQALWQYLTEKQEKFQTSISCDDGLNQLLGIGLHLDFPYTP